MQGGRKILGVRGQHDRKWYEINGFDYGKCFI